MVIIDQISKFYIKGIKIPFLNFEHVGMYPGQSIPVIGDFFKITFIENPGMAFGFNPGTDFKFWISLFSFLASIAIVVYLYLARNRVLSLRISLALILGGAIGNLIDRAFYGLIYKYAPFFYGRVVDFLDFDFFNFTLFGKNYDRWPIFNLADASVTIGVLILLIFYKQHAKEEEEAKAKDEQANEVEAANNDGNLEENKNDVDETDNGKEISL